MDCKWIYNSADWTDCTAACGDDGVSYLYPTLLRGADCVQPPRKERACNRFPCSQDCAYTWTDYGECSRQCGGGYQTRTAVVSKQAVGSGKPCPISESRPCNEIPCDRQDIVWAWGEWGTCSKTCGGGTQTRSPRMLLPAQNGGDNTMPESQSRECNVTECEPP